jgi:hypothetical protein
MVFDVDREFDGRRENGSGAWVSHLRTVFRKGLSHLRLVLEIAAEMVTQERR